LEELFAKEWLRLGWGEIPDAWLPVLSARLVMQNELSLACLHTVD